MAGRAVSTTPQADAEFRWGVVGPGKIAQRFAEAVSRLPNTRLQALHARNPERAQAFAQRWQAAGAPTIHIALSLEALLADPDVDAVYIATPHSEHRDAVEAALLAGKPVLCEKPLVTNRAQAHHLSQLAHERNTFLMEALWTRFLPAYQQLGEWLASGAIGTVQAMQSSFCFRADFDPSSRIFNPALAGGALLDIGIYNLAMTRWVRQQATGLGDEPVQIDVQGRLAPTGVDARVLGALHFADGFSSQFVCAVDGIASNALEIHGSHGCIRIPSNFWEGTRVELHRTGESPVRLDTPFHINGFEGEIVEAMRCVRAGLVESPQMTHADTLCVLGWMDTLRARLGVVYPFD